MASKIGNSDGLHKQIIFLETAELPKKANLMDNGGIYLPKKEILMGDGISKKGNYYIKTPKFWGSKIAFYGNFHFRKIFPKKEI